LKDAIEFMDAHPGAAVCADVVPDQFRGYSLGALRRQYQDRKPKAWPAAVAALALPESPDAQRVPDSATEIYAYRRALEQIIRDPACAPATVARAAIAPFMDWVMPPVASKAVEAADQD
jgi:hypothetical protein